MSGELSEPDLPQPAGRSSSADPRSASGLLPLVYEQLRAVARQRMALERARGAGHTLQPTALIHEAYARLVRAGQASPEPTDAAQPATRSAWRDRREFFLAAAREMERVLVDHARGKFAEKRGGDPTADGGWKRVPIDILELAGRPQTEDALALHDAILRLEEEDPQAAAVVRLRFFAGLSAEQSALTLGVSERTVVRDWSYARAFLASELGPDKADDMETQ